MLLLRANVKIFITALKMAFLSKSKISKAHTTMDIFHKQHHSHTVNKCTL